MKIKDMLNEEKPREKLSRLGVESYLIQNFLVLF